MKIRNYIYALMAVVMISITSCKDQFELELLNNPNAVTQENADVDLYFSAIQLNFQGFLNGVNRGAQPAVRMRVLGGITYENFYSNSFAGTWSNAYANIFPDIDAMTELALAKDGFYWVGAGKVIRAWTLMTLVDFFGDIPYSEAGLGTSVPSPVADDQRAVYDAAFALLDGALADFTNPNTIGVPGTDMFYPTGGGGPGVQGWINLANTLKLRYHLTTRLVNAGGGAAINAIIAGGSYIGSGNVAGDTDDFAFKFSTNQFNPNSRHPWYNGHYNAPTGGGDYLSNDFMFDLLKQNDPRIRYYVYRQNLDPASADAFALGCPAELKPDHYRTTDPFCLATLTHNDPNSSSGYWGRDHGNGDGIPPDGHLRSNYGVYPAGGVFDAGQGVSQKANGTTGGLGAGIHPFMLSSYVDFMRAEAALTMSTGEDDRFFFEKGIRASIEKTMNFAADIGDGGGALAPSAADITAYVDARLAEYDVAGPGGKLDLVIYEYKKASWGAGVEIHNAYRRTGYPSDMQPTENLDGGTFPRTMFYPDNYVNLNENAVQRTINEQVFWDTNPAGFIN